MMESDGFVYLHPFVDSDRKKKIPRTGENEVAATPFAQIKNDLLVIINDLAIREDGRRDR